MFYLKAFALTCVLFAAAFAPTTAAASTKVTPQRVLQLCVPAQKTDGLTKAQATAVRTACARLVTKLSATAKKVAAKKKAAKDAATHVARCSTKTRRACRHKARSSQRALAKARTAGEGAVEAASEDLLDTLVEVGLLDEALAESENDGDLALDEWCDDSLPEQDWTDGGPLDSSDAPAEDPADDDMPFPTLPDADGDGWPEMPPPGQTWITMMESAGYDPFQGAAEGDDDPYADVECGDDWLETQEELEAFFADYDDVIVFERD
jgi:hypothetical protein